MVTEPPEPGLGAGAALGMLALLVVALVYAGLGAAAVFDWVLSWMLQE